MTDDKIQKTPDILTFDRAFAERYFTKMDLIGDEAVHHKVRCENEKQKESSNPEFLHELPEIR